mmetsp:Transcript_19172/g.44858  ORF Transcript_19172/g.44858 Transcript_19172/m.44858 type:complete len:210 (+) Transcript_19172:1375-2004(+)
MGIRICLCNVARLRPIIRLAIRHAVGFARRLDRSDDVQRTADWATDRAAGWWPTRWTARLSWRWRPLDGLASRAAVHSAASYAPTVYAHVPAKNDRLGAAQRPFKGAALSVQFTGCFLLQGRRVQIRALQFEEALSIIISYLCAEFAVADGQQLPRVFHCIRDLHLDSIALGHSAAIRNLLFRVRVPPRLDADGTVVRARAPYVVGQVA